MYIARLATEIDWDKEMLCFDTFVYSVKEKKGAKPRFDTGQHGAVEELTLWLFGDCDRKVHNNREDKAKHIDHEVERGFLLPEFCNSCIPKVSPTLSMCDSRHTACTV